MSEHTQAKEAPVRIQMRNIVKMFGSFKANDGINLEVRRGEIHAILGENGAGKSTLMNILYGMYPPTGGQILVDGKPVTLHSPNDAIRHGIGMVHQHFMLVEPFTVTENIILGMEPTDRLGRVDLKSARQKVLALSEKYGLNVNPDARIEDISVGMQQRAEILKVLYRGAETLILDEPTSSLTPQEIVELVAIMRNLVKEGKSIILITHKLREIKEAADVCTIIRQGRYIATVKVADVNEHELAGMMVGRNVEFTVDKKQQEPGEAVLVVKDLTAEDYRKVQTVNHLNLTVHKGEIVGIAGIDGNGQTELVEVLTGLKKATGGSITMNGKDAYNKTPRELFDMGVSSIPADRQKHGLVLDFPVEDNLVLQNIGSAPFSKNGRIRRGSIRSHATDMASKFDIRPAGCETRAAGALSGGNQQKVIIAREVTNDRDLLIAVNPTRGLDVGAIEYVHRYIVEQRNKGKAVLLVSFELDEVMSLSDRIDVLFEGKIVHSIAGADADENQLGLMMAGGKKHHDE